MKCVICKFDEPKGSDYNGNWVCDDCVAWANGELPWKVGKRTTPGGLPPKSGLAFFDGADGMTLQFVKPSEHASINVLLYGPPKTGKTAGACSAPGGILLMNLDLPNAVQYARSRHPEIYEIDFRGMDTLIDVHDALNKDAGDTISTVVVDPIGDLHRRLLEEASGRAVRPSINHYGDVAVHIERFCRALCEMPGFNVVIVCHEAPVKDEASGTMEKLPWTGTSNPALGSKLMGMVDIVGYTGVIVREDGTREHVAQLVNDGGRRGGDRFDVLAGALGYRPLDLSEWVQTIREARTQTPNQKAA